MPIRYIAELNMKKTIILVPLLFINLILNAQQKMKNTLPFTPSLQVDNLLFISGQVGINPETSTLTNENFDAEVKQVMENLKTQLQAHGLTLEDLVSTTIYLKDMKNYAALNERYSSYFENKYPTRTCIAVLDLPANASVEISGIAHFKTKE